MKKPGGSRLIVVGGRQRKKALDLDEWQAYECGVILEVDLETLKADVVVEYHSPEQVCPDESPSIVFKAGDLHADKDRLLVCTQTEVMEFALNGWEMTRYFSHSSFNDLHHASYRCAVTNDGDKKSHGESWLLANTGLDQVVEVRVDETRCEDSKIINHWSTCEEDTWDRFDPAIDYRKVATTKPHQSHPNFVFEYSNKIFATRFHQQDAFDLSAGKSAVSIPVGNPHDGIVQGNGVRFTTTNGHLVDCDLKTCELIKDRDLNQFTKSGELLGWCRGVCATKDDQVWVGFSRIRPTWLRKNLSWIKQGFRSKGLYGTRPTRISLYDLGREHLIKEIELEQFGMNAIFGIYPLP